MKKKELLIILILAVLVTLILVILVPMYFPYDCGICQGVPLPVYFYICGLENCPGWAINIKPLILDVIFWFVVLAGGWWVLKIVLKKIKMKK